jgi:glycosyltransferase involved in cell wall biosynthesis
MRIAMILRRLNVKGGTQRQALSLARELKARGHEVVLFTLHYDRERCYPELLDLFEVRGVTETAKAPYYAIPIASRLPKAIRDIFEENRAARALAESMPGDLDLLNPHDQVSYKVAAYYKKRKKNIPSIWNMNDLPLKRWGYDHRRGQDDTFHQSWYRVLVYRIFDWYDKWAFIARQDAIVVVDFFNRRLVAKYLRLKAHTVRSGPDFEHFAYREKQPLAGKRIRILTSGILMLHRRYEDAIRGVKILRDRGYDATLTVMGDYENDLKYYEKLKRIANEEGVTPHVTFTGRVSEEALLDSYHNNDVYTFQHHLQSDGLSPFEAAACGCPLVVSKTAGCHEVLTDRENVLLIEPKNPRDYADKIAELVDDPALYAKMARAANSFVRGNFSWQKYADGILEVVERVKKDGPQIKL